MWTRLQDGFQSRLIDYYQEYYLDHYADPAQEGYYEESKVAHLAWKPYAVYLNGVYWGNMNLRERTDRYMLAQPRFRRITLNLSGGRRFTITPQSLPAGRIRISHSEITGR